MNLFYPLLTMIVILTSSVPVRAQLFQVTDMQFSAYVSNDGKYTIAGPAINEQIARSKLSQGKLYLSFTMVGLKPALDYLEQNGSSEAHVVVYAGMIALKTIDCGIVQEKWSDIADAVSSKFNTDHFFTFRTWMYTQQITYDTLTLIVRDENGREINRANINIIP